VSFLLIAAIAQTIFKLLLALMAIFLILLVLVQRGRGGGLAGALGGMGGSSAFGAKAGDVFTRVTIVAAAIWICLCVIAANLAPKSESRIKTGLSPQASQPVGGESATKEPATEQKSGDTAAGGETASGGADQGDKAAPNDHTAPGDEAE
jgi:preprotein translocase subunit SecG